MTCPCGNPAIYTEYGKWFCLACWQGFKLGEVK